MTSFASDTRACVQVMRRSRSFSAVLEMAQHLKLTSRCTQQPQARPMLSCNSSQCSSYAAQMCCASHVQQYLRFWILTHHQTGHMQLLLFMIRHLMALHEDIFARLQ